MQGLLERLEAGDVLVGDGAWGTLLMSRGLGPGQPPESVNLKRPEVLEEIAGLYLEAGADLITTNTFGGSPACLGRYGLADSTEAINRVAVEAARRAAAGRAYVSGSVGPSGQLLEPYGDAPAANIAASFERQILALAEAGADLVCIETMTDLTEATLAVRAARAVAPHLPVMATMTFEATRRGFYTVMGTSIERAVDGLAEAGADIVGSNCGNGSAVMVEIAHQFRALTARPVAIQPNAGVPEARSGEIVYPEEPGTMAENAAALRRAGVAIIGGCCGTTPAHIRAIREAVRSGGLRSTLS
jgi:5-methyltetrahydrofolate--homocysteine methyltransferase